MANSFVPFGFSHVGVLDGVPPTFAQSERLISASNATKIFKGDPVTKGSGTAYIVQSTPGTTQIHGIFLGCKFLSVSAQTTVWRPYWPGADAASDVTAFVVSAPTATFLVQANAQLLPAHVGQNANFAIGTGTVATGLSGASLDVSTIATTNTLPLRIVSLVQFPVGANGSDQTSLYGYAVVTFNNQDFKSLTGI